MILVTEHPQRRALIGEAHARPFLALSPPERASHLAFLSGEGGDKMDRSVLAELCGLYGVQPPPHQAVHFTATLDGLRLRWERHTEFSTYTIYEVGAFDHPFEDLPIRRIPKSWLETVPGELLVAAHVAIDSRAYLSADQAARPIRDLSDTTAAFGSDDLVGAIVVGGQGEAYSNFQLGPDGFTRFLVHDRGLRPRQAGRLVQRILEIETYRTMAMMALPLARQAGPQITLKDHRLAGITQELAGGRRADSVGDSDGDWERELLARMTQLAAEIEELTARGDYRFSAAAAYHALVEKRIEELREDRIQGLQTFAEFMDRRLTPAMRTCRAVAFRQSELSARVSRASQLLRARVDVALEQRNRELLESMDRRAKLQLRLQETVESVSVVAITYYAVSIVGYVAKALEAAGFLPVSPDMVMGGSIPVLAIAAWWLMRRMRRLVLRDSENSDKSPSRHKTKDRNMQ